MPSLIRPIRVHPRNPRSILRLASGAAIFACALATLSHEGLAAEAPDYNTHVAPLFKKYCAACHNAQDAEGKLVLESYDSLLKGGGRGAAIVPGKADQSRLVMMLEGKAKPAMPPEGSDSLKSAELALLKSWIDSGAKSPTGAAPDPTQLLTPRIPPLVSPRLPINAAAYSPDGKLLALGGYGTVRLLSAGSWFPVRELKEQRGNVNDVAFSANGGELFAAAGEAGLFGELRRYNVDDGQLLGSIVGHRDCLYACAISPDGQTAATAGYDEQIRLWDVVGGKELRKLSGHNGAVFSLAFSPDGKLLASASGDRTVKLWSVANGDRLDTLSQSLKELYTLAFSPDGKRLAAGGVDNRIRVWTIGKDAREGTNELIVSRFAHEGAILRLAYSKDGKHLVSTADDRTVKVWQADTVVERRVLEKQPDAPGALAVAPDSKSFVVARLDGSFASYDIETGKPVLPGKPELASVSPRGIERGTTARLHLTGKNFTPEATLKFSRPQVTGRIVPDGANSGENLLIEATVKAKAPRGPVALTVATSAGASAPLKIEIDDLPQVAETEPNDLPAQAATRALPVSLWGAISQQGDNDSYSLEAKRGETIVFDLQAATLGSKLNGVLTLVDGSGKLLANNNDFDGAADPFLAFTVPADGRYTVRVSDLSLAGSPENFYRLSIGTFPFVTACFPLAIPASKQARIELAGFNMPADAHVLLGGAKGELPVSLESLEYRSRRGLKVLIGDALETVETEPNDDPAHAAPLALPAAVNGRIFAKSPEGGDADLYRISVKAKQTWIVETDAARRGSPVDTRVEVLDAAGNPVERVWLQAVRDSYVTFRPIDSQVLDVRVKSWEEMELNEYLYMQGEVCKLFRAPQGPDSGFSFYGLGGKRRCYFDTSGTTHALDESCYIVEPHKPGTSLVPNGLPTFPLYFANDDDADRKLGSDSRLTFTAPADGDYLLRVTDVREQSGDRYAYRLIGRPPRPDFSVALGGGAMAVAAGSGKGFTASAERSDGFEGDIDVEIKNLPAGFSASGPLTIQAGHVEAKGVLNATADAKEPSAEEVAKIAIVARATIDGATVEKSVKGFAQIKLAPKPDLLVTLEPAELTIAPGTTVTATLKVQRNGFKDRIQFAVDNLPHGVIVDNIGLSGVLIPEGQSERQIFLSARPWAPETSRPFHAVANNAGAQASRPAILHVRKSGQVAKAK